MIFYAAEPSYFASFHEGVPDDGMKSCHVDTGPSSYCYGGGSWANRILTPDHTLPGDYYSTKKLVKDLGLPIAKINACKNGCMLYWKDDVDLEHCIFCGDARYKPSRGRDLCWKKSPYTVLRCIMILQYGCTYSCWPVIITPYNLQPGMCMSFQYMFLTMVIPGPSNPKRLIDVYLELLIEELLQLWHVGVRMYNHAMNKAFIMQATLMRTVNDLPACGVASRWSTTGNIGCPVCMDDIRAFHLQHGRKACYLTATDSFSLSTIHNKGTRKPSQRIVSRIREKTKDNMNAHRDLMIIYNHPELELDECRPNVMPKAVYTLANEQKRRACERICGLKFPDGYASNLARCVDITELQMHSMKSPECHSTLTEVSLLFQSICSTTLDVPKLHELENSIAIILCNIEKIFQPSFFDSMEYLIVHLPYEARVYRWMYPFEIFLSELKKKVKSKAHVEASIVEAYIVEEIDLFISQYFEPNVQSKRNMSHRNDEARAAMMESRCLFSTILAELVVQ
ncbi:UNVERIFIED_CONTAM: hypothetical protein Sradi_4164400 [Sesamum radiatum]|uniref:DUF4218 domain-containing protein n=1 Tax=Sesamum radiatum TaxID=300843 RepID=A0AAW2P2R4_SESRA